MPVYRGGQRIAKLYKGTAPIARAYKGSALVFTPRPPDLIGILQWLGLTAGLKLCLDAGDAASYDGSSQTWLDRSPEGTDFLRGATGGSEASDPAFNGTPGGLSSAEYFGHDGADYCTIAGSNPAWVNALHKAGAQWTFLLWAYLAQASSITIFGNSPSATRIGFRVQYGTSGQLTAVVTNGSSSILIQTSVIAFPFNQWVCLGVSLDEAAGVGGLRYFINGVAETESNSAALASPSAADAGHPFRLGAVGGAPATGLPDGSRVGGFLAYQGLTLTDGQKMAFFNATRGRFGV